MKRLFAALKINPDQEFLASYRNLQSAMKFQQIKWVEEHNIHITLKFFGDTEERKIPAIIETLRQRASNNSSLIIHLSRLGIFGSKYDPKVIWVGIEPFAPLAELMQAIREDLKPLGYEPDRQNLVPHLTLGRVKFLKDKVGFGQAMDQFREIRSGEMQMDEIVLYESILRREGPTYISMAKCKMQKR